MTTAKKILFSVLIGLPLMAALLLLSLFYGPPMLEDWIDLLTLDMKPDSLHATFMVMDSMNAFHHFDYKIEGSNLYLKFYSDPFQINYPRPEIVINDDLSQIDSIYQITSQEDRLVWTAAEGLVEFFFSYTPEALREVPRYSNRALLFFLLESEDAYIERAAAELYARFLANASGILEEIADFTPERQAKICSFLASYPLDNGLEDKFEIVLYRTDKDETSDLLKALYEQKKQDILLSEQAPSVPHP